MKTSLHFAISGKRNLLLTIFSSEQPQRPLRILREYGDENAIPAANMQKTIHQRNKSSPALSTMMTKGSKRTAFGDVSHVANINRPSKDDMILNGKNQNKILEKPMLQQNGKQTAPLMRPAQRPLSVSAGLKSILGVGNGQKDSISKQPLAEIQQNMLPMAPPAVVPRKFPIKKSIAVLKDVLPQPTEQPKTELTKPSSTVPLPPVHRDLPAAPPTSNASQDVIDLGLNWREVKDVDIIQDTIAPPEIAPPAYHQIKACRAIDFRRRSSRKIRWSLHRWQRCTPSIRF